MGTSNRRIRFVLLIAYMKDLVQVVGHFRPIYWRGRGGSYYYYLFLAALLIGTESSYDRPGKQQGGV